MNMGSRFFCLPPSASVITEHLGMTGSFHISTGISDGNEMVKWLDIEVENSHDFVLMTTIQMFSERPLSANTVGNRRLFEQWSIIVELRVAGVSPSSSSASMG